MSGILNVLLKTLLHYLRKNSPLYVVLTLDYLIFYLTCHKTIDFRIFQKKKNINMDLERYLCFLEKKFYLYNNWFKFRLTVNDSIPTNDFYIENEWKIIFHFHQHLYILH